MLGSASVWASRTLGWAAAPALCLGVVLALIIALLPTSWVTVLVLGAIVLVATLVHPQFGVLLILPAVPFASLRQVTVGVMNVGASEALVVLVLAAWLMRMVARREVRIELPPLALPMAILIGVMSLSLLGTTSMQHSLKELLKWIEILALYLLVANEMDTRWTRAVVLVALGTGALAALHGIYQFLFQVGPEEFVLFGRFMRAFGTFEQPNPYAGYLGVTLPLATGLLVAGLVRAGGRVGWKWMAWAGACGALMAAALAMSWSRGAWLGFAAALAAIALAVVARSGRGAVLATLFLLLIVYGLLVGGLASLPSVIVQRFSDFVPYLGVTEVRGVEITDANFAVLERVAHWQSAASMWTDRPWLGIGIGNYEVVYPDYALPLWPLPLGHAHNYYLNAAAETGVLGLGAYLVLWGAALVLAWKTARQTSGLQWGVALGVLGMLAHLSTHNLFDNLYVHAIYLQVAILLGVIATYGGNKRLD